MATRGLQNGPWDFGHSKQLSLNKFFDPSAPYMKKGRDGRKKTGGGGKEKTDDYSGHYVIASSRPPKRRTLMPKYWSKVKKEDKSPVNKWKVPMKMKKKKDSCQSLHSRENE